MLTQEYLKECFDYDTESGNFIWKIRPLNHFKDMRIMNKINSQFSNKIAGYKNDRNYLCLKIKGKEYKLHRLVWLYVYGQFPKNGIDHINGIKTDNRICNLREADQSENSQNIKKYKKTNNSKMLGVSKKGKIFYSRIMINKIQIHLGCFKIPEKAHEAYLKEKRKLHPYGVL